VINTRRHADPLRSRETAHYQMWDARIKTIAAPKVPRRVMSESGHVLSKYDRQRFSRTCREKYLTMDGSRERAVKPD